MSKTSKKKSNLTKDLCAHIATYSPFLSDVMNLSPDFFGWLRLPKLFHRYSLYCVSLKTLLVATVKVDQWSLLYKVLNGSWVQMKLIRWSYQIIDITMPKIWQVMVSIILIKNFAQEDHRHGGDGP